MKINCLWINTFTPTGRHYSYFHWDNDWYCFINLAKKHKDVRYIILFLDYQILQKIGKDSEKTVNVRIRILCGLINKISPEIMSIYMKSRLMECVWNITRQFKKDYNEWYCKNILELPF